MTKTAAVVNSGRRASDLESVAVWPLTYEVKPDWLDKLLEQARAVVHVSPTLCRALTLFDEPVRTNRLAYASFLDSTLRTATTYEQILNQYDGIPFETEFKSVYREAWAFLQEGSANDRTKYVLVIFDGRGYRVERIEDSPESALDAMVCDGYVLPEEGALFKASSEGNWAEGAQSVGLEHSKQPIRLIAKLGS